jgi:hypothetical protein
MLTIPFLTISQKRNTLGILFQTIDRRNNTLLKTRSEPLKDNYNLYINIYPLWWKGKLTEKFGKRMKGHAGWQDRDEDEKASWPVREEHEKAIWQTGSLTVWKNILRERLGYRVEKQTDGLWEWRTYWIWETGLLRGWKDILRKSVRKRWKDKLRDRLLNRMKHKLKDRLMSRNDRHIKR